MMRRGYGRNFRGRSEAPRLIEARYDGECCSCGGAIKAGMVVTYWPGKRAVSHANAQDGDRSQCPRPRFLKSERTGYDPAPAAYPDPGELAADRWSETHE